FAQGSIVPPSKPSNLLDSAGRIFGKSHPQYANYATSEIISVKSQGAAGDGRTDDTAAIQNVINEYAGCKIIFFDAGSYYVTNTIYIPAGTQIVGEAWSVILAGGSNFASQDTPTVVVQAGEANSQGVLEISDIIFSTVGPAPGAIMIEWNVHDPSGQQGAAGMWDSHIRLGGAAGTNLQNAQCPSGLVNANCQAAFLGLHLTAASSAYLEACCICFGTWIWTADHDLDASSSPQLSIFTGRGVLSESAGPVWMIGTFPTAEHSTLYQYNLVNAQNHWMGFIQTETPYYQPVPAPPGPFFVDSTYRDPDFPSGLNMAWAVYVQSSHNITLFGGEFYSLFQNYDQGCLDTSSCQIQIISIDSSSSVTAYCISTVGTTYQLSVSDTGVIEQSAVGNGLPQTFTAWSP
ncbi:pectin lyase fold/virulence factor, partial [Hygrophoropsis aurantiaca]